MAKEKIKRNLGYTGDTKLIDVHRVKTKAHGGEYVDGNVVLKAPIEHMGEHGNLPIRDDRLESIKAMMDDRNQVMRLKLKIQNQLLAYERKTDHINEITEQWLKSQLESVDIELTQREKMLSKEVVKYGKENNFVKTLLSVPCVGPITAANLICYIDIEKARHASSLWSYVGLDVPSHERYTKGEAGGGNKTLRTALYVWADVQIKHRSAYRDVYDQIKARLEVSEKIVKTRNTEGKLIECQWKDTKPSHRHGSAIRIMIKHFLADYWMVCRTMNNLPTDALYAEAILGGNHATIQPKERGWIY